MSAETQELKKKVAQYIDLLKNKTNNELSHLRSHVLDSLKSERSKEAPNKSLMHDYDIQLSFIGREMKRRQSESEKKEATLSAEGVSDAGEIKQLYKELRKRSVDELKKMLDEAKMELVKFKEILSQSRMTAEQMEVNKKKLEYLQAKFDAINEEIISRGNNDAENAGQKENVKKFMDEYGDYVKAGVVGGLIGGVVGHSFGKNIWGYGLIGVGVGSGIVWIINKAKEKNPSPAKA